uniref:Ig-like domain-containing protein n=1 Tax=Treponema sp. TaxID=166 RepID=UPI0025E2E43E
MFSSSLKKICMPVLFVTGLFLFSVCAGLTSCSASSSSGDSEEEVSSVTVSQSSNLTSLAVGETLKLKAVVYPLTISDPQVTWKSSSTSVATVDDSGLVTGVTAGSVTITAKCGGKSGTYSLTVTRVEQGPENNSVVSGATDGTSVGTSGTSFIASSNTVSDYTVLVWSDEFEGTSLKTENWAYETGDGGWGNCESQNYTNSSDNSEVDGGVLRITVKGDGTNAPTSARIKSQDKKYFKYGKLEARIKFDEGNLSWPAFWMLGQNMSDGVTWPYCGEIDIMEHINTERTIMETVHWNYNGSDPATDDYGHGGYGTGSADYSGTKPSITENDWHIYGLKWTEDKITMYVDDVDYFSVGLDGTGYDCFNNPFFFILNFAAGGELTGSSWAAASAFAGVEWNMYVDYIRVYQDANHVVDGNAAVAVTSVDISGDTTVTEGSTVNLTASVSPSDATDSTVTWTSSDTSVATVSSSGVVTGVSEGTVTITAAAGGVTDSVTVSVEAATVAVTSVTISGSGSLLVGSTTNLTASVSPSDATDSTVTWTSSNTSVATVSSSGVVTGVSAGTVTITATAGGVSGTKTVSVTAASASGITAPLSGYSLIWNDEFDSADSDGTPLSSKWGYDIGAGVSDCTDGKNPGNYAWGNGELQWYSDNDPDNTYVSDGTLKIVAKKESSNGMNYTSGRIVTRSITGGQWKYGYIEMSAKIPNDKGVWPAFWMLDQDIYDGENWPGSGEIDIMESSVNLWGSDNVYGTLHCTAGSGGSPVFTQNSTVTFSDGE